MKYSDIFLNKLGISDKNNLDLYPKGMFEKLEAIKPDSYEYEYFDISGYEGHYETLNLNDIVGSISNYYYDKTWIYNFLNLRRLEDNCKLAVDNPDYYITKLEKIIEAYRSTSNTPIEIFKKNNKYYIINGHHRLSILKLIYLTELEKIKNNPQDVQKLNQKYSIKCFVRQIPHDFDFVKGIVDVCDKYKLYTIKNDMGLNQGFDEFNYYVPHFEMIGNNYDKPTLRNIDYNYNISSIDDINNFIDYLEELKANNPQL